jgi:hypothetical protein
MSNTKNNIMHEPEKTGKELSKIKRDSPFGVPENYFDNFYDRLRNNIHEEDISHSTGREKIIKLINPALQVAAVLALIAIIVYSAVNYLLPESFTNYNASNEMTMTEEERIFSLIENIDENSFFTLIQESSQEEIGEEEHNNDELLSYLSYNISEYEIFIENDY